MAGPTSLFPGMYGSPQQGQSGDEDDPIGRLMSSMTSDQRGMLMQSMLGSASQALLSLPKDASVGQMLLAVGSGALGGRQQGIMQQLQLRNAQQQEKRADRRFGLEEQILQQRQQEAATKAEQEARRRQLLSTLPPEQQRLYDLFGDKSMEVIAPKPPAEMTPYQEAMLGLSRERLDFDRSKPPGASDPTALMANAQYLARVKNIPEAEAADFLLQSSAARSDPDKARDDIFKLMLRESFGDPQEAWQKTNEAMTLLEGGPEALPAQPAEGANKGVWAAIKGMFGAGDAEPAAPMEAAPGVPGAAGQGMALPPDPSALQAGQTYTLPDGRRARYDGAQFEVLQ